MTTRLASLLEIPIRHRLFGLVALAPLAAVAAQAKGGAGQPHLERDDRIEGEQGELGIEPKRHPKQAHDPVGHQR